MRFLLLALSFLMTAPAAASNFWIPADDFDNYTDVRIGGSPTVDDRTGKLVQLLGSNQQVRIKVGLNNELRQYLKDITLVQTCAYVANYDSGATNTVLVKHVDANAEKRFALSSTRYQVVCSQSSSIEGGDSPYTGFQVVSPNAGAVKLRGVFFRGVKSLESSSALANYEFSRALGYIWADGRASADGNSLLYPRTGSNTSRHLGSVAESYFGNALSVNSQGSSYSLKVNGLRPSEFLSKGMRLSDIPDKQAFLTSVIETEGAVRVARIADDGQLSRCNFIADLVNDLNPRCSSDTCTSASCKVPNCAFVADKDKRGIAHKPGKACAAYLSGDANDWRSLFNSKRYHFVKTDRTPGGEPTKNAASSRPSFTKPTRTPAPNPVTDSKDGYVFSRTDKQELRWIATTSTGAVGNIWISQSCSRQLGGPSEFGDWSDLKAIAPEHDSIPNPCKVSPNASGYVFSRTDKNELRWIAPNSTGVTGSIWISQQCSDRLGGPKAFGDWNKLLDVAPAVDTISYPCN